MIDSCTKHKIAEKTYKYEHKMKIRNAFKYSVGEDLKKNIKRNASLRKCVSFLFNFLVVANKTWCFFLCVVCCLNIWMYFTAVRICQRYHISCFLFSFLFFFLNCDQFLSGERQINCEFDIMPIFMFPLFIILLFSSWVYCKCWTLQFAWRISLHSQSMYPSTRPPEWLLLVN